MQPLLDSNGTSAPNFNNVTINQILPPLIYDPWFADITGTLTIENDPGGNNGNYLQPRKKYGSCTTAAGATTNTACVIPSGLLRSLAILPDAHIGGATSVQVVTGTGGTIADGGNFVSQLSPGVVFWDSSQNSPSSLDTSYVSTSVNYKNQAPRYLQVINTSNASATTLQFVADYWPAITQDASNMVGQDVPSFTLPSTVVQTSQSNSYTAGVKQTFNYAAGGLPPINLGCGSGIPSGASQGDMWCDSSVSPARWRFYTTGQTNTLAYLSDVNTITASTAAWNNSGSAIAANTCITGPTATPSSTITASMGYVASPTAPTLGILYTAQYSNGTTAQVIACNVTAASITIPAAHSINIRVIP